MKKLLNPVLKQLNKLSMKRKKIILSTVVIVIAGVVGYYFLWGSEKAGDNYITGTVKKGTVANTIPATGTIEPVSTVDLSFENAEIINKIYVKVGDHVTTGQLLAEQEEDDLQAEVAQSTSSLKSADAKLNALLDGSTEAEIIKAETSVNTAQSSYDQAKVTLDRYQKLFEAGAVSQSDLDSANNSFVSADSNLRQAKATLQTTLDGATAEDIAAAEATVESSSAQLKMKVKSLDGAKMSSPMNGIVSVINGGEGQRASANNNSTSSSSGFISLISEALQVEAQVNEADIGSLKIGQAAELTVNSFPNKTFTGKISSISPVATTVSNVQVYDTVIQLDENQTGLKAGMPATITIIVEKSENTLTVPKGAVTYAAKQSGAGNNNGAGGGTNVIVMDRSGNMTTRKVVLGLSDSSNYEVLEGLNEGETVVIGTGGTTTSTTSTGSSSSSSSSSSSGNNRSSGASPMMGGGGPPP